MAFPEQIATAAERAASAAQFGGAGVAVASGGARFLGYSSDEWAIIGAFVGMTMAVLGFFASVYFKNEHLKLARKTARADPDE